MSDFGETFYPVARVEHRCEYCYGPILKGERHFQYKGMYDGEWQNWRMHQECHEDFRASGDEEFSPGDAPMPERVEALVKLRDQDAEAKGVTR